jgi:Fic family protein
MRIVSGPMGKEKVHYEAPPSDQVPDEMARFIAWFNRSRRMSGAVRAGVAHLWFECIHPFPDGNGRVGRAIAEVALSQELQAPAILSLSTAIERRRPDYYDALSRASRGDLDITQWLLWFTELALDAQAQAKEQIAFVLAKARFWDRHAGALNERQAKALARMLREGTAGFEGGMSARKYVKITGVSKATATRDLAGLVAHGALRKLESGGRSTRYEIVLPTG